MANYTPPAGNAVNFTFSGIYTPPPGDEVDLYFGVYAVITIHSVSKSDIFDDVVAPGFDQAVVTWSSDMAGDYRVEVNGSGAETGTLIESGRTFEDFKIETLVDDSYVEAATTFSGAGDYKVNIYVKNSDGLWTPYNYEPEG